MREREREEGGGKVRGRRKGAQIPLDTAADLEQASASFQVGFPGRARAASFQLEQLRKEQPETNERTPAGMFGRRKGVRMVASFASDAMGDALRRLGVSALAVGQVGPTNAAISNRLGLQQRWSNESVFNPVSPEPTRLPHPRNSRAMFGRKRLAEPSQSFFSSSHNRTPC